jgi:hypothetical protein
MERGTGHKTGHEDEMEGNTTNDNFNRYFNTTCRHIKHITTQKTYM